MAECKSVMIHLNITAFQQLTCAEAISQQAHNVSLLAKDRSALRCSVPNHVTPKIHVDREEHVMWLRNCKELNLDKNTDWVLDSGGHLTLPRVTYQHPGVYTCAVTYNGMTRYAVHHRVCVKPKNGHGISVKCSSSVYKHQIQEDVTINCRGTGAQDVDLDSLRFMLTKTTSKKRVCNVYGRG
uniref:Ig-like domain-containing protein n=1 Tax=Ciona savignyi TaxID=51511 RepID=H2Z5W7_CIOSA